MHLTNQQLGGKNRIITTAICDTRFTCTDCDCEVYCLELKDFRPFRSYSILLYIISMEPILRLSTRSSVEDVFDFLNGNGFQAVSQTFHGKSDCLVVLPCAISVASENITKIV